VDFRRSVAALGGDHARQKLDRRRSRSRRLLGLPIQKRGADMAISEVPSKHPEVVEIRSDRGPLNLGDWPSRFRFA
jgi:hypothetical protein